MSRLAAGRVVVAYACLLTFPLLALGQESGHSAVIPAARPPASICSSSTVQEAALNLPDAPLPTGSQAGNQSQSSKPAHRQKAPSSSSSGLTLQGLGFTPAQTQSNAKLQARLNKRTRMLQIHQKLGLITLIPMAATVLVAPGAEQRHPHVPGVPFTAPSSAGVDLHVALGSLTALMYGATAYYAIAAPRIKGMKLTGPVRLHRDLAFIHVPGMVLMPILGAMALNQENKGEKVHGIAAAHSAVAATTLIAYAAAVVTVSWPIHWKFWEHRK